MEMDSFLADVMAVWVKKPSWKSTLKPSEWVNTFSFFTFYSKNQVSCIVYCVFFFCRLQEQHYIHPSKRLNPSGLGPGPALCLWCGVAVFFWGGEVFGDVPIYLLTSGQDKHWVISQLPREDSVHPCLWIIPRLAHKHQQTKSLEWSVVPTCDGFEVSRMVLSFHTGLLTHFSEAWKPQDSITWWYLKDVGVW